MNYDSLKQRLDAGDIGTLALDALKSGCKAPDIKRIVSGCIKQGAD